MECCSACGQRLPKPRLLVDLNNNAAILGEHTVRLRPLDAEILKVLHDASPRLVTMDHIEQRVLGNGSEERCPAWIRVRICLLRKKLGHLPISISNCYGIGYRLTEGTAPSSDKLDRSAGLRRDDVVPPRATRFGNAT